MKYNTRRKECFLASGFNNLSVDTWAYLACRGENLFV